MENENIVCEGLNTIKISFSNLKNALMWCKRQKNLTESKHNKHKFIAEDTDMIADVEEINNKAYVVINYFGW